MALCLLGLLAACGGPAPPPPATLSLTVEAGADQNPDPSGRPSPVAIHIYQLSGRSRFDGAEVFALLERERDTLGDELAGSESVVLAPRESKTIEHPLKKGTQALGVAVAFRDIDRATWRVAVPVAESGPSKLKLIITGTTARLEPVKPS
jgi:type VI secretion system protein VasD